MSHDKEKEFLEMIEQANMLRRFMVILAISAVILVFMLFLFGCKTAKVEDFSYHWAHHEVQIDTNGLDKTLQ